MIKEAENMEKFLKMIAGKGTKELLEFLDENKKGAIHAVSPAYKYPHAEHKIERAPDFWPHRTSRD